MRPTRIGHEIEVNSRTRARLVCTDTPPIWWDTVVLAQAIDAMLAECEEPPNTIEIRATLHYKKGERSRHAKRRMPDSLILDVSYHRAAGERVDWTVSADVFIEAMGRPGNIQAAGPVDAVSSK